MGEYNARVCLIVPVFFFGFFLHTSPLLDWTQGVILSLHLHLSFAIGLRLRGNWHGFAGRGCSFCVTIRVPFVAAPGQNRVGQMGRKDDNR